jgi:hypothetical protein
MIAASFHFHTPTEHTFGGNYADFEMHVIHNFEGGVGDSGYYQAINGFRFSSEDYDKRVSEQDILNIQDFYESLDLPSLTSENNEIGLPLEKVMFTKIMGSMDYDDRYVYIGSKMKPPC